MKTKLLLAGVLSATLLLGACGNEDNKDKPQDNKSESVEKKKEAPKKEDKAKETEESKEVTENVSTEEPTAQETVEQPVTQEEPASVEQQEDNPSDAEMEDKSKTAWGEDYENMPNGDAMFDMPGTESELSDEEIAEAEKEALREKYNGGLSSGEIQTKNAIEQGYYDGDDADEVMAEIEKSEQEIAEGKYDQYKE